MRFDVVIHERGNIDPTAKKKSKKNSRAAGRLLLSALARVQKNTSRNSRGKNTVMTEATFLSREPSSRRCAVCVMYYIVYTHTAARQTTPE